MNQISIVGKPHCHGCGAVGETPCKPTCAHVGEPLVRRGKKKKSGAQKKMVAQRAQRAVADGQVAERQALVELLAPLQARAGVKFCFQFNKVGRCQRDGCNYFPCCCQGDEAVKAAYAAAGL